MIKWVVVFGHSGGPDFNESSSGKSLAGVGTQRASQVYGAGSHRKHMPMLNTCGLSLTCTWEVSEIHTAC